MRATHCPPLDPDLVLEIQKCELKQQQQNLNTECHYVKPGKARNSVYHKLASNLQLPSGHCLTTVQVVLRLIKLLRLDIAVVKSNRSIQHVGTKIKPVDTLGKQ